jgi:hypothetical protein
VNSIGLISAQSAQTQAETRPRAHPRWPFCKKGPGVLTNWRWVWLLFHRVADNLQISPTISISSQTKVHDGGGRREVPASTRTARFT